MKSTLLVLFTVFFVQAKAGAFPAAQNNRDGSSRHEAFDVNCGPILPLELAANILLDSPDIHVVLKSGRYSFTSGGTLYNIDDGPSIIFYNFFEEDSYEYNYTEKPYIDIPGMPWRSELAGIPPCCLPKTITIMIGIYSYLPPKELFTAVNFLDLYGAAFTMQRPYWY